MRPSAEVRQAKRRSSRTPAVGTVLVLVLGLGCYLQAQAPAQDPTPTQTQAQPQDSSAVPAEPGQAPPQALAAGSSLSISPGDLLVVDVFNTPELSGRFRVSQSGMVSLPQGGVVTVSGRTAVEAGQEIERRLRDGGIMLDPHVTVFVQEYASQGVIVLGEVRTPGTYTLLGEHSLYGALAAAGGATGNEGSTITVTHAGDPQHKIIIEVTSPNYSDLQRSTRVNPGDTVFVSRGALVYVYGEVARPGAYSLRAGEPLNVLQALALAQGADHFAAGGKASIIRQTATGVQTIPIDLKLITRNEVPDPVLQASDIVVIPRNGLKAFVFQALPGATGAVLSSVITASIVR